MAPIDRQKSITVSKRASKKVKTYGYPLKTLKMVIDNLQLIIWVFS